MPGRLSSILFWLPLAVVVGQSVLYLTYLNGYLWSVGEDGAYEWATFAAYAIAVPVTGILAWRWLRHGFRLRGAAYLVFTLGLFFIAGEEISWGQRIFNFAGPEVLVERNLQNEANLHNLLGRLALEGAYIALGIWGIGLGRVVVRRISWLRPVHAFAPGRELFWWFFPVFAYYVYVDYLAPGLALAIPALGENDLALPPRFQEPMEFLLGVGFLLFVLTVWQRDSSSQPGNPAVGAWEPRTSASRAPLQKPGLVDQVAQREQPPPK